MSVRVRFAPSPTGMPHVGVIRTAIFDWLLARHHSGQFVLRIEDTDRTRFVEGAVENIVEALQWLGLDIDEGPDPIGGQYGPYFQSQRLDLYYRYADYLLEKGFAYWCDCSTERLAELREQQASRKENIGYDGNCRARCLSGAPGDGEHVLRFKIPRSGTTTFHDELRGDITVMSPNRLSRNRRASATRIIALAVRSTLSAVVLRRISAETPLRSRRLWFSVFLVHR